jgi:hypothetical protein
MMEGPLPSKSKARTAGHSSGGQAEARLMIEAFFITWEYEQGLKFAGFAVLETSRPLENPQKERVSK